MAASIVNKIALAGICKLKSLMLWTKIAVIPDNAPNVIPRTRRLGFFSFLNPFLCRAMIIQIRMAINGSPISEVKCK